MFNGCQGHSRAPEELVPLVAGEEASSSEGIAEKARWRLSGGLRPHRRQPASSHAHHRRFSLQAPPAEPRRQGKGRNLLSVIS